MNNDVFCHSDPARFALSFETTMKKGSWYNPKTLCLLTLACLCLWAVTGCIGKHPMKYADYELQSSLNFQVGDCFELLQNMYLFKFEAGTWKLSRSYVTHYSCPVVRVVSAGETIQIHSLKRSSHQKYLFVYSKLATGEEWVFLPDFESPAGEYNKRLFKKLSASDVDETGDKDVVDVKKHGNE